MTAVEFSAEDPYGKAVALLNLKSGFVKVHFFNFIFAILMIILGSNYLIFIFIFFREKIK